MIKVIMRILVVRTDFMGDAILINGAIESIKSLRKDVVIDVLATQYNKVAFEYNPYIENKYFINHRADDKVVSTDFKQVFDFSICYDLIIVFNRDLRTYKYIDKIKSKRVFGFRLGRKKFKANLFCILRSLGTRYSFMEYDTSLHEVVNTYNLLNFVFKSNLSPLRISKFFIPTSIDANLFQVATNSVCINISGRVESGRVLSVENLTEIINDLNKDVNIVLIATKEDLDRANQLLINCNGHNIRIFSGDIYQVARVISLCICYVGVDGGLTHLAAGLDCYVIGIYAPNKIKTWCPWTDRKYLVCSQDLDVNSITPKEVSQEVNRIFKTFESNIDD